MVIPCARGMVAISVFLAGSLVLAAVPDPVADNAALHYWRAFGVLPTLDDKQEACLRDAAEKPGSIDEKAAAIIQQGNQSMKELYRGTRCSRCVWATPLLEDGAETLLPHCAKARQLARLACARAALRLQKGQTAAAIDDLVAAMTLGRHVASDTTLVSMLVDYAIERRAIEVAAQYLGTLQPSQLDDFAWRLDRLPTLPTMRQAMQTEKDSLLDGFIRDLSGPNGKEKMLKVIGDSPDANGKALSEASQEQLRDAAIALRPVYDAIAAMMDRPFAESKSVKSLLAGMSPSAQAMGMGLLPAAVTCRTNEMAHRTRLAMLKTAVAVVRRGPEAIKDPSLQDPYTAGPFAYEKTAGGFRLTSKTHDRDGSPIALEVGKRSSK